MGSKNLISIIIPVFNGEKWIERCLSSVLNQTYSNLEVLVIDDGSTDDSHEIVKRFASMDERIVYVFQQNSGVSCARNLGILKSTGEYIQFVDCDDWIEPEMCEVLLNTVNTYSADLVICGLNIYHNNQILRKPALDNKILHIAQKQKDFRYAYRLLDSPCNKIYRKQCIKNIFDSNFRNGEDMLFNLNYIKNIDKTITIPENLYNVSIDNQSSLNRTYDAERLKKTMELLQKEYDVIIYLYGENLDNELFENKVISTIFTLLRKVVINENYSVGKAQLDEIRKSHLFIETLNSYRPKTVKNHIIKFLLCAPSYFSTAVISLLK